LQLGAQLKSFAFSFTYGAQSRSDALAERRNVKVTSRPSSDHNL
jgi:hypothetical protein